MNVIPDSVTIGGTCRTFSKESFIQLKRRIEEVYLLIVLLFSPLYSCLQEYLKTERLNLSFIIYSLSLPLGVGTESELEPPACPNYLCAVIDTNYL